MENLVIICGHQKLPGKIHLFGAEFTQVAKKEPDGIPFILKICASEIENRALCLQVHCNLKIKFKNINACVICSNDESLKENSTLNF